MALKVIKRVGFGLLILPFALITVISILKLIAENRTERLTEIGTDGTSRFEKVRIGGIDQWLFARSQNRRNPVLLILHGGPGAASIGFAREFYRELEEDFVVVNWDQRYAGKSFSVFTPGSSIEPETFVSDTHEVVAFLKQKYGVSKIYLMGHSWGAYIAAIVAHRYPSDFYAYIGIGPVVNGEESVRTSYALVQEQMATEIPKIQERQSLTLEDYLKNRRYWLNRFRLGMFHGSHGQDEDSYLGGLMFSSPEYSLFDIATYPAGLVLTAMHLREYFFKMNLFEEAPSIDVPVYFATGSHDGYNPPEILVRYMNVLKSPRTKLFVFEDCAHAPHFEEPENFAARMRIVKEETLRKETLK
jgi:pimeloyl-ACP methyl ester carboxylesterase